MARLTIYDPNTDRNYFINLDLARSYRMSAAGATEDEDIYVVLTTDIQENGLRRNPIIIRTLSDVPPDGGPATSPTFSALFDRWVLWLKEDGGLGVEDSSSSSSSSSLSSSSSSSD